MRGDDGSVYEAGNTAENVFGVRPALKLDLSRASFNSETKTFILAYPVWIGGVQVTSENTSNVFGDGKVSYTPAVIEGDVTTPAKLTLNNYTYKGEGYNYAAIYATEFLTLEINGTNTITQTGTRANSFGIYVDHNLTITGTGVLNVSGDQITSEIGASAGIWVERFLKIEKRVMVQSIGNGGTPARSYGVFTYKLTIDGTLVAIADTTSESSYGIRTYGHIAEIGTDASLTAVGENMAVFGGVRNPIPGIGWADATGTTGKIKIVVSTTGQDFNYKKVQFPAYTVTYQVVGGTWSDDSTTNKTETVQSGAKPASVPTGMKAASGYTGGAWNTDPANATITGAATFTYTFMAKQAATVDRAPTAKNLTYNSSAQELVTAGTATGGDMQYALGTATEATQPYTISIPKGTDAGTYYVWYKVKGDDNHNDTVPVCIPVTISATETVTITFNAGGGLGSMAPVKIEKGSIFTFPTPKFFPPVDRAFAHWRVGEKQYVIYDEITVTADITVTAVWTDNIDTRIVTHDLTSVPKELEEMFSSITLLKNALLSELSTNGQIASRENSEFQNVELQVLIGGEWVKATKENFPKDKKLSVTLPYPAGTGMNTHDFTVAHMFTVEMHSHKPGQIETPSVTKEEGGITVELDGLSPVAISWTKIDNQAIDSLPQTGDAARPLLYGLLALVACIGLGLLIKKK